MFKPLIPVISDIWSHEFNEIEHISIVHAKYGSHHLQKEVADTDAENNQKSQNTLKSQDQVPFHVSAHECYYNFERTGTDKQFLAFILRDILTVSISRQGPPPKFS